MFSGWSYLHFIAFSSLFYLVLYSVFLLAIFTLPSVSVGFIFTVRCVYTVMYFLACHLYTVPCFETCVFMWIFFFFFKCVVCLLFQCKHCGKAFASHAAHDSHVRRTHSKERPCSCNICGKTFSQSFELKFHMNSHLSPWQNRTSIAGENEE